MELIPILSTIILVATISTFLLAIGAYILYKVRERKGSQTTSKEPAEIEAELVTPVGTSSQKAAPGERIIPQPIYVEQQSALQRQPIFVQQRNGMQGQQQRFTPGPQPYGFSNQTLPNQNVNSKQQRNNDTAKSTGLTQEEKQSIDSKFMKYTAEGYIPAKDDKKSGALKWR